MAIDKDLLKTKVLNNSNILDILSPAANNAPVAADDQIAGTFSGMLSITPSELLANDRDLDGDTLRGVNLLNAVNGSVYWDGTHVVFLGEPDYSGPASFEYQITDDNGHYAIATVNLSLTANTPPTAVDDMLTSIANAALTISPASLLANDYDLDGDAIEGVGIKNAVNGVVTWDGTNVIFTPTDGYTGAASFTYTITDNNGGTSTATVNLNILANSDPDAADDDITATENNIVFIQAETLLANDSDLDGDTLTGVSLQDEVNGKAYWDGSQVIFIPENDYYGPASFTYTITDGRGGTDTATVNLSIVAQQETDGLHADGDYILSKTEGPFTINADILTYGNRLIDTDVGESLKIVSVQDAMFGTVALDAQGNVLFTPVAGYKGPAAFSYTVEDVNGAKDTAIVNIEIEGSPLEITVESGYGQRDNVISRYSPSTPLDLLSEAQNGEVEETYTPSGFGGGIEDIFYSPNDGYVGTDNFMYAERNYSSEYGGYVHTIGTAEVTVKENVAPEGVVDNLDTSINSPLVTPTAILVANDIDPEAQEMTVMSVQDAVNGTVTLENGNAVFIPNSNFTGQASYTYTLSDNRGNTDTQTVNVSVSDAALTILTDRGEQASVAEDTRNIIGADSADNLLNNTNVPEAVITSFTIGDSPTVYSANTLHQITESASIRINNDGSYEYNTARNFNGEVPTIYYTVSSNGQSVISTLDLTVTPVNDAPVADDVDRFESISTGNDDRYLLTSTDTLINQYVTDIDGDALTITDVQATNNVTVELIGNNIYVAPTPGFSGTADFEYVVSDGNGGIATATYEFNVLDRPLITLEGDNVTTTIGDTITIPMSALFENDVVIRKNVSVESLFSSVQDAVNGSVEIQGDNIVFTPEPGYTGAAAFSYTISNLGVSETATVNLSIGEVNKDAPNALADDTFESDATSTRYTISTDDLISNDKITIERYELVGFNAQNGSVSGGNLTSIFGGPLYVTPFQFVKTGVNAETFAFDYLINDGEGNISIATVDLNVPTNQAPVAQGETLYTLSNDITLANSLLLANDTDPENDNINLVSTQNAEGGEVNSDNEAINFMLDDSSTEPSFQYSIDDGQGNYDFAQVDIIKAQGPDLIGTESAEILYGNAENNSITANDGDDIIISGKGDDTLTGGLGADMFVWTLDDTEPNQVAIDRITDFNLNEDKLDIKDLIEYDAPATYIPGQTKLDVFLDFEVEDGNTAINIRNLPEADVIQTIVLEGVALEVEDNVPPYLYSNDSRLLYNFDSNIVYD